MCRLTITQCDMDEDHYDTSFTQCKISRLSLPCSKVLKPSDDEDETQMVTLKVVERVRTCNTCKRTPEVVVGAELPRRTSTRTRGSNDIPSIAALSMTNKQRESLAQWRRDREVGLFKSIFMRTSRLSTRSRPRTWPSTCT